MDEKSWWDFWNTSYRIGDDNGEIPNELFTRVAAIVNQFTRTGSARVLEIACGTGTLSRLLTYSNYQGIDISPAAINIARQTETQKSVGNSLAKYDAADFHDWPLPTDLFDVAVCVDAIAYFRDQQLAISKMARSLRRSGWLVLTTINPFIYSRIRRTAANPLREGSVSHWLSRRELRTLVEAAGFAVERLYTIMPRGNRGFLRLFNSYRLNQALGPGAAAALKRMKEKAGLGQYSVVVARKQS